jgi:chemotaxis protein MotA
MLGIVGIVVIFGMVFGGYVLAGGKFGVIIKSLPFEMMMIGGAATGAFLIGNGMPMVKQTGAACGKAFKGPKWSHQDFRDLLCLMFAITKTMKMKGLMALEAHIEKPAESPIFSRYPKILHDHFAIDFICDTLRMMSMDLTDPHQVEDAMEKQLEKHHHEALAPAEALQGVADALPALGIVAAVLGVIKTMASISEPPEILGKMIGGALVGTFLGVFLAYGFVGPMASRVKQIVGDDHQFYLIIRDVLVAHLHGNAAQISVEIGRGNVPSTVQPSFGELEDALNGLPADAMA